MTNDTPTYPEDILYLPIEASGKGPETRQLPGTWDFDGTGCKRHGDFSGGRWGIVDTAADDWRLLIVDLDVHKMSDERAHRVESAIQDGPETRVHESQSGGLHVFYWLSPSELNDDGKLPVRFEAEIDDKLNGYVLSPYCAGYEVRADRQPATITVDELPEIWISGERVTTADRAGLDESDARRDDIESLSVYDVITNSAHPEGKRVAHPVHGSSTGTNFMVDAGGDTWRCWRHDCTGNALHLLGMDAGIIDCGDWPLSTSDWSDILDAAEDRGLIEPSGMPELDDETVTDHAHVLEDRRVYDSIDDVDAFPCPCFVLDKPPREGGSYWIMRQFVNDGEKFIILAPRHAILKYHLETLADLVDADWSVVHFEGKTRVCESDDKCAAAPTDYEDIKHWESEVRNIVHRNTTITAEDCPTGLCKYWFLKKAAEFSDIVLTVPQLARRFDPPEGAKLFIDEEQSLKYFQPGSVDLCTVRQVQDTDGTPRIQLGETTIRRQLDVLDEIRERIEDEIRERKESSGGFREVPYQTAIIEAIDTVHDITEALGISNIERKLRQSGEDITLGNTIDELTDRLTTVKFPEVTNNPDQLKDKIDEYCAGYFWDESAEPAAFLEAVLFPYTDNPFHIKDVGNERSIRLIGDAKRTFFVDWLQEFEQTVAIAGPEGERFMADVDPDACVISIKEFRYADDFIVLPLGKMDGEDSLEPAADKRERAVATARKLNWRQRSAIAVTGTKDQAWGLHKRLSGTADVVTDPPSPAKALYKLWTIGATAIIYENSVVSRGIDAPFFDVTVITTPGFSTPYWEAKRDAHDKLSEDWYEAAAVERELKDRELTNAALRMSPTYDIDTMTGTKFIVAAIDDVERLKFLDDRIAPRVPYAETAADLIEMLTVNGAFEEVLDDVYTGMGESEKGFIKTGFIEAFAEIKRDRPEYTFDEIETWVDSRYLTGGVVEDILSIIESADEPPTTVDIYDRVSTNESRVSAILSVLERRGDIYHVTEDVDEAGCPAKYWHRGT